MPATVRAAAREDMEAVLALATAFATSFTVEEPAFRYSFQELLVQPEAYLAVAEQEAQVVGYLLGFDHCTLYANGRVSWVEELMVSTNARRHGVGRSLVRAFEAWSVSRGSRLAALATRRAADFYQALGYRESATYFRKLL